MVAAWCTGAWHVTLCSGTSHHLSFLVSCVVMRVWVVKPEFWQQDSEPLMKENHSNWEEMTLLASNDHNVMTWGGTWRGGEDPEETANKPLGPSLSSRAHSSLVPISALVHVVIYYSSILETFLHHTSNISREEETEKSANTLESSCVSGDRQ